MKYRFEVSDEANKYAPKQVVESQGSFDQMMADIYRAVGRLDTVSCAYHQVFLDWCKKLIEANK